MSFSERKRENFLNNPKIDFRDNYGKRCLYNYRHMIFICIGLNIRDPTSKFVNRYK